MGINLRRLGTHAYGRVVSATLTSFGNGHNSRGDILIVGIERAMCENYFDRDIK